LHPSTAFSIMFGYPLQQADNVGEVIYQTSGPVATPGPLRRIARAVNLQVLAQEVDVDDAQCGNLCLKPISGVLKRSNSVESYGSTAASDSSSESRNS